MRPRKSITTMMKSTTRTKKAAAAAPKSNIDIILDKLQPSIHAQLFGSPSPRDPNAIRRRDALVANCEEALRVLRIKRASLNPKKDTPMVRAALVIEYLSRNAPSNNNDASGKGCLRTTLPLLILAKAVGFQKKDMKRLETMQTIMASYLDRTSIGKQKRGRPSKRAASSVMQPDVSTSSSMGLSKPMPMFTPTNLIRDLCIQLGPMIPDAEFATSYATGMLHTLVSPDLMDKKQNSTSRKRFSKYELRKDMERNQEHYEAACFYLAVKKSEGQSSHLVEVSKKNAAAAAAKKDAKSASAKDEGGDKDVMDEEVADGDEDRLLQEVDVIRAANLLEGTFKTVLQYVRDWTEGVTISLTAGEKSSEEVILFGLAGTNDGKSSQSTTNPFEQWKEKVLQDAKASVMQEGGNSKDWLTIAADKVLRKAGL